jgi:hypothetical protein
MPEHCDAPLPPGDGECCGNGCERCVWTVYQEQLEAYRRAPCDATSGANQLLAPECANDNTGGKMIHGKD